MGAQPAVARTDPGDLGAKVLEFSLPPKSKPHKGHGGQGDPYVISGQDAYLCCFTTYVVDRLAERNMKEGQATTFYFRFADGVEQQFNRSLAAEGLDPNQPQNLLAYMDTALHPQGYIVEAISKPMPVPHLALTIHRLIQN